MTSLAEFTAITLISTNYSITMPKTQSGLARPDPRTKSKIAWNRRSREISLRNEKKTVQYTSLFYLKTPPSTLIFFQNTMEIKSKMLAIRK